MANSLEGRTVALAEGRQLEELASLLDKEGAKPLRCPLISILDVPDPTPVVAWLRELCVDRFDLLVLLTGEGLRRLLGVADRAQIREPVLAALGRTRIVTRGPKPGRALREVGLTPTLTAESPTTEGVIATLSKEPLQDKTVGVQLYREENRPLDEFLRQAGAVVRSVLPYSYAPAADGERVVAVIGQMERGEVDALIFTSAPQVDRLYEVARERGLEAQLTKGLGLVRVAAVGPMVADAVREHGGRVSVCPEQGFVMKNLVQHLKRSFESEAGAGRGKDQS